VPWYREDPDGVTFAVRVVPRASHNELVGLYNGALKVRVTAPPVEGAANEELVKFLARKLGVSRTSVTLVAGSNTKQKLIRITDPTAATREQLTKLS
jgi:uncharacterized protein (TIGR00251 family)